MLNTGGVLMTRVYRAGCPYGTHRVVEPKGAMPQAAWKVDNSPEIRDNEILVDVEDVYKRQVMRSPESFT